MCVEYLQACHKDIKQNALNLYPFIGYAGRYWAFHAKKAFEGIPEDCCDLTERVFNLLDSSAPAYLTWLQTR